VPTVHLGPAVAHMEAKGIRTGIGDLNREIRSHNAAVRSVKAVIASLEKWLAATKEKLARLFEKEEQKPTLFDVLTAYNSLRRDERSDWSKYGKQSGSVADLKFFSSAVNWMQRAGVVTVEDFDALLNAQKPAISKISENEKRIRKAQNGHQPH
jgi:septal ring factor EnvC (AmiA/AmiB activator)